MPPHGSQTSWTVATRMVVFDAVGTLIHPQPSVEQVYADVARRHQINASKSEITQRISAMWQREAMTSSTELRGRTSHHAERVFWQDFVGHVFPDASTCDQLFEDLWSHFAEPRHWRLYDDVLPVCHELRARGYVLHIASNFDARLLPICRELFPAGLLGKVFSSADIGWKKPSAGFFAHISRTLRCHPFELVYVGDSLGHDVLPARQQCWNAIHLLRRATPGSSADDPSTIEQLSHLIPVLEGDP